MARDTLPPLGEASGRFNCAAFLREPLWHTGRRSFDDGGDDDNLRPNVYGQTLALAHHVGGQVIDLAGGCIGVLLPTLSPDAPEGATSECIAYDADDMRAELVRFWENEAGDNFEHVREPLILFGSPEDAR